MKKLKKLFISLALSAAMIIPAAFPQQGNLSVVSAATIKINTKSCTLVRGKSKTLSILGTKKKVTWKSSKPSVATVSSKGKVTAKKAGTTTITATVNKIKYTCKVTVKNPVNNYVSSAPYKAIERKVGNFSLVVPESWGFSLDKSNPIAPEAIMLADGDTGSNVYVVCTETEEKAPAFSYLKEELDKEYTPEIIEATLLEDGDFTSAKVTNYVANEYKTPHGSAYKVSYSVTIDQEFVMKQTIYDFYFDNYYIVLVTTDLGDKNLETITDYIMRTFSISK